jgi:hypothetical protein
VPHRELRTFAKRERRDRGGSLEKPAKKPAQPSQQKTLLSHYFMRCFSCDDPATNLTDFSQMLRFCITFPPNPFMLFISHIFVSILL